MTPTPEERWRWDPGPAVTQHQLDAAPHHYLAIAASAETPKEGPSWPLATRSLAAAEFALDSARGYWPDARSFDLIGSDQIYPISKFNPLQLPPGMIMLRNPDVLMTFTAAAKHKPAA